MKYKYSQIEIEITHIKKANLRLKNDLEQKSLDNDRQIDSLINDIIQIVDAYEKSETKIKEMGLMDDENAQKVIKRMLQPKKVALSILFKYNVAQIDLDGKLMDENTCSVVDTEPDSEKEDGFVLSVEKNGYVRGDRLIRRAEVIVVRNS
jgi:molecular chaperone GrpE (heat shock protein)